MGNYIMGDYAIYQPFPVQVKLDIPNFDSTALADCRTRLLKLFGIGILAIAVVYFANWLFAAVGGF